ncbi:MAG: pilus assembly FimT family protein [Deltaproteobacteria bacterium]
MSRKEGFTLIELSVAILLVGVFALVAAPKFQDLAEVNIKSASRRLGGTIKYLYNEAVFKKKVYRLSFDIDRGEYWVETLEGNEFFSSAEPQLRRKKLPDGVRFKDVQTERSVGKSLLDEREYILFSPKGFVEPAVIHIETESGSNYTLVTKPYTGGTIVYDEYVEFFNR